jgi:hypothetical protein
MQMALAKDQNMIQALAAKPGATGLEFGLGAAHAPIAHC